MKLAGKVCSHNNYIEGHLNASNDMVWGEFVLYIDNESFLTMLKANINGNKFSTTLAKSCKIKPPSKNPRNKNE